jgi:hypothetical protein
MAAVERTLNRHHYHHHHRLPSNQRDEDRYVSLAALAKFKKVALLFPAADDASLNYRAKVLAEALEASTTLEVS